MSKFKNVTELFSGLSDESMARIDAKVTEMTKVIDQHNEPEQVTIDGNIIAWLKQSGDDYQQRINELLGDIMLEDLSHHADT